MASTTKAQPQDYALIFGFKPFSTKSVVNFNLLVMHGTHKISPFLKRNRLTKIIDESNSN